MNLARREKHRIRSVRSAIVAGGLSLTAYWLTLATDLTWSNYGADGGELITAAVTLGIPHPPGSPIYVLIGKLASYVPLGTIAYRFNLLSACSASIAAGFIAATAYDFLMRNRPQSHQMVEVSSIAVGLVFALSPLVWTQAVIAEVYALNLAFLSAFLWSLLSKRSPFLIGILLGLSVTTHLTSLLMLPLASALTNYRQWTKLGVGLVIGSTPFLLIPLLARTGSPVVWGDPSTLEGWWWLVTGRIYHGNALAFAEIDFTDRLRQWSQSFLRQFTLVGPLLLFIGLYYLDKELQRQALALLGTSAIFIVYAFFYNSNDAIVYALPGVLMLAIMLAPGIQRTGWLSLLIPLVLAIMYLVQINSVAYRPLRPAVERLFSLAPEEALLITPGDATIFALWYYHHVENQRADLVLVDRNLFAFDWYRQHISRLHPELAGLDEHDMDEFRALNNATRPVCSAGLAPAADQMLATVACD